MWSRRPHTFDIRPRCPWRKSISLLSILLVVNTIIHWTLVDDIGSSFDQPDDWRDVLAKSKHSEAASLHDRVISINAWEEANGQHGGGREVGFDGSQSRDSLPRKNSDNEPLIIYITRKPSNRRPLGEAPGERKRSVVKSNQEEIRATGQYRNISLLLGEKQNMSDVSRKVGESRRLIGTTREKILNRKRDLIRNRSVENREIDLPFLQKNQTKLRSVSKQLGDSDIKALLSNVRTVELKMNYYIVDVYSSEKTRYYSRPEWFTPSDISSMNLLAGSWILDRRHDQQLAPAGHHRPLLLLSKIAFERLARDDITRRERIDSSKEYGEQVESPACQTAWCSRDLGLVVAFHLDRVIGLNITPPAVARELPVGRWHPTAQRYVSHRNETRATQSGLGNLPGDNVQVQTVSLIVTSSLRSVSSRGVLRSEGLDRLVLIPESESDGQVSATVQEHFYIFCFLLQVTHCRIDKWKEHFNMAWRHLRSHGTQQAALPCHDGADQSIVQIFSSQYVFYEAEEDSILRKLRRLSSGSRYLLQAGRIRQRLLQSLFVDRMFWLTAGGRRGIEQLLNVIDGRVKELADRIALYSKSDPKR